MDFINTTYILYINLFFLLLLGSMLLYLVIKKIINNRNETKKILLSQQIRPKISDFVFGETTFPSRILQHDKLAFEVIEDILSELTSLLKDEKYKLKINHLATVALKDYYKNQLSHSRWSTRMNTYFNIENFEINQFHDLLWEKYNAGSYENIEEHYQQMKTLAGLRSNAFLHFLVNDKHEYPKFIYKDVIRRYGESTLQRLISDMDKFSDTLKQAIIETIGDQKNTAYLSTIENALTDTNKEVRLSALKVLQVFKYVSNTEIITSFAQSPHFPERMMFARLCIILKKERYKPDLVNLLSDSNWFVRNAAGEALNALSDGELILNHIAATHEDTFAREMALQWIKR